MLAGILARGVFQESVRRAHCSADGAAKERITQDARRRSQAIASQGAIDRGKYWQMLERIHNIEDVAERESVCSPQPESRGRFFRRIVHRRALEERRQRGRKRRERK